MSRSRHVHAPGNTGLGQSPMTHNASLQVTVEEDSYLAHPTRDRAKIQHSRRPPTRGHLMAVVCKTKKVTVAEGPVPCPSISGLNLGGPTRGLCDNRGPRLGSPSPQNQETSPVPPILKCFFSMYWDQKSLPSVNDFSFGENEIYPQGKWKGSISDCLGTSCPTGNSISSSGDQRRKDHSGPLIHTVVLSF